MGNNDVTLITDISFLHHSEQCLELLHYLLRPGALNSRSHTHMAHACIRGHTGRGFLGEFFLIQTKIKMLFHTRNIMSLKQSDQNVWWHFADFCFAWNQLRTGSIWQICKWVAWCIQQILINKHSPSWLLSISYHVGKINLNGFI